jgi:hypothetical protein
MSAHTLSRSTHTVELQQVVQVNERLLLMEAAGSDPITADRLGLSGAGVVPKVVDRAAALVVAPQERRREVVAVLRPEAPPRRLLASGPPSAPYLYAVFAEGGGGRRELPVAVHTDHLRLISGLLNLRGHLWGV